MKLTYFIVDVFTERAFDGAQIAVFPEVTELSDAQMQLLARELNLPETVFVLKPENQNKPYRFKVFSPTAERNFSGQATLAAAYVLGEKSYISLSNKHNRLQVEQNAALIDVVLTRLPSQKLFVQFSLQAQGAIDKYVPTNRDLAAALALDEQDIVSGRYNCLLVSCDRPYLIVPLRSFAAVRRAVFDFRQWSSAVAPVSAANEILLFSAKSDLDTSNFHGRLVGPQIGIDEDPPIASSIPAFSNYLTAHGHSREGTYTFVIDRGTLARRKSILSVESVNRPGKENEVRLGGPAVLVAEGKICIP